MMDKVRIHEVAKELGINSKEVVEVAKKIGINVHTASSSMSIEEAEALMKYIIPEETQEIESEQKRSGLKIVKKYRPYEGKKMKYVQKIYFGHPATGKSFHVHEKVIKKELEIESEENIINTVFHPEYSYGDFMGKLLPHTNEKGEVQYWYYSGHFLEALSKAYRTLLDLSSNNKNVCLIIDEINRGNSAAIFGSIFQLLDRDEDGWSSYSITLSNMEFDKLIDIIFGKDIEKQIGKLTHNETNGKNELEKRSMAIAKLVEDTELSFLIRKEIKLPPNLSIIGTMNTSDDSIYYMDSAFKRRWDWEFTRNYWGKYTEDEDIPMGHVESKDNDNKRYVILDGLHVYIENKDDLYWTYFVDAINKFILSNADYVRGVEDKQIGYWFIKSKKLNDDKKYILLEDIKNKLMFFIWDNVFNRDKTPLINLLSIKDSELITFGDFQDQADLFIEKISLSIS